MKKKNLLFTAIAIFGLATITSAQVPNYVPTTGLVGWWPFNGNANDESGNGNNGTVNGATLTSDRNGLLNSSYNFNVTNWSFGSGGDNIYIPYNPSFNFSDFTISTWVKRTSAGSAISPQSLSIIRRFQYGYNNPNGETWVLEIAHETNPTGALLYGTVIEQSPSPAASFYSQSNQIVPLNQWCNIIMTYSQDTISLYINNQLVGIAIDPSITINTVGNSGISIGLSEQANGQWAPFDGSIDDIGIWNRSLTECEIQNLFSSQLNSTFVSAGIDQTICNGDPVTLSAMNSQNYSWDNGVTDGVAFNPTSTQDYTVSADSAGCLSTDVVTVTVNEHTTATQTETALDTYTWPINSQTYTQSGTYTAVIPNAAGCDSTITLNLTMNYTSINETEMDLFSVSPNPTTGFINIQVNENLIGTKFKIQDEVGRLILKQSFNSKITTIDLSELSQGIYFLKTEQDLNNTLRIIKLQ